MKTARIFRLLGSIAILSLLALIVPALPIVPAPAALATNNIEIDPEEGTIGDTITITGENFGYSDSTERWATIYFSSDDYASTGTGINDEVTVYEVVADLVEIEGVSDDSYSGEFETTFEVPEALNDGPDSDDDEDVEAGEYYVYVTVTAETATETNTYIYAYAEFTVIGGGEIEINYDEGPVGTAVTISGTGFPASDDVDIEYDGDDVDIEEGDDETNSSGNFDAIIYIPESTAGDHTISVTVGSSEVEATFTVEPELTISPTSGEAGATVSVYGTGFGKSKTVDISFPSVAATATTSLRGTFSATFEVPAGLAASSYTVIAEDSSGNDASVKFTVIASTTEPDTTEPDTTEPDTTEPDTTDTTTPLSLSSTIGSTGSLITVAGIGFMANSTVTVYFDETAVAQATADANGIFATIFQVPTAKSGSHNLSATDGSYTSTATFSIETTAPEAPTLQSPAKLDKAASPAAFLWSTVSDDSLPVTYDLQIATDSQFTSDSIVLSVTEITTATYTLSETENTKLTAAGSSLCYWRVRAVDAASNTSDWSAGSEFYPTLPFNFVESPYFWVVISFGAVILLLVGFLVGRKTAYSY